MSTTTTRLTSRQYIIGITLEEIRRVVEYNTGRNGARAYKAFRTGQGIAAVGHHFKHVANDPGPDGTYVVNGVLSTGQSFTGSHNPASNTCNIDAKD